MALARPPIPSDESFVGPLIRCHPTMPTVSIVMPTRPEAHLRSGDRRRLARAVSGAERRLSRTVQPSALRRRLVRRLWDLADNASRRPARQGVALIAGPDAGRLLALHYPVTDRTLIGPAPTYEELVERSWGFARIAVLLLTGRGARLIACDDGAPWEPRASWDPVDTPLPTAHDILDRANALARSSVPPRTPLVVAGDDRMVRSYLRVHRTPRPARVLAGDHSETSAAALVTLAKRALRSSLDDRQQAAMVSLVLAVERGTAWQGADPPRVGRVGAGEILLIESGAAPRAEVSGAAPAGQAGAVVVVPDGFLAHHDGAVLVPDHRAVATGAVITEPDVHDEVRRLTLLGTASPC